MQGIEYDIKHKLRPQLFANHRYLTIGYNRLKEGKKWGDWTKEDVIKYHAKVVDALRDQGYNFPIHPNKGGIRELDLHSRKHEAMNKQSVDESPGSPAREAFARKFLKVPRNTDREKL